MSARHRKRHPYTTLLLALIIEIASITWLFTHMGQATPFWSCTAFAGMTVIAPCLVAHAFTD